MTRLSGRQPKPVPPLEVPQLERAVMYYSSAWWNGSPELSPSARADASILAIQSRNGQFRTVDYDGRSRAREQAAHPSIDQARAWCDRRVPEQSEDGARVWLRDEASRAGQAWETGPERTQDRAWQARERARNQVGERTGRATRRRSR